METGDFRDYLHSKGQTVSEYKDEIREEIVYQHMLSSRKRLKADVSPNRVESYYKENELKFKTDTRVRLREIMLFRLLTNRFQSYYNKQTKSFARWKVENPSRN